MKYFDYPQGSPEWRSLRRGRLTMSKLHIVMTGTIRAKNKLLSELGNEFFAEPEINSSAVQWGRMHEAQALANYRISVQDGSSCGPCGFFLHPSLPVGGSPDGIVLKGDTVVSGVEIKCPFNPAIHAGYLHGGAEALPASYIWQVRGALWLIRSALHWDFVTFDPRPDRFEDRFGFLRFYREESSDLLITEKVTEFCDHLIGNTFYPEASVSTLIASGVVPKFFT